ncbi:MAG: hypothetical protein IKT31_02295 [Firmicutes bacterium]|nr:hypothetical protein [Bacillota bacterium]
MGYPRVEIQPDGFEFFNERIRYVWDKEKEEFYFSVVDVIQVLTDSVDATAYWRKLKQRLKAEGNETVTLCHGLKLKARDGKKRFTDVATMERMVRIIQSVPSPKAEPIKLWLAQVGSERIDEMIDPEIAIDRAVEYYRQKGYPDKWITQRVRSIEARRDLTDEWQRAGVKSGSEFAVLTNVLTRAWSGMNTGQYKELKGLHKENLRDNMTNTELALNMLAKVSAAELSKVKNPEGFEESQDVTVQGGTIAGNARRELEKALGKSVISSSNANDMKLLDTE